MFKDLIAHSFQQWLGQNFYVACLALPWFKHCLYGTHLVELCCGFGALTTMLAKRKPWFVGAVEIDEVVVFYNLKRFKQICFVHHTDASFVSLNHLTITQPISLCGNIAFNITKTVLVRTVQLAQFVSMLVLVVNRMELIELLASTNGLVQLIKHHVFIRIGPDIPQTMFCPKPNVIACYACMRLKYSSTSYS